VNIAKLKRLFFAIVLAGFWFAFSVVGVPSAATAASSTALSHKVAAALRANDNLNGANCYAAAPGVIVLYGKVFDNKDRDLAESTAFNVHGVKQVVNTLRTTTGKWLEEEARINDTLVLNDLQGVSVKVVGREAYVSGQVETEGDEQRALRVIASESNLRVVNFIRVVPGSIF
jgi:osmotically-inducible protein OsmY